MGAGGEVLLVELRIGGGVHHLDLPVTRAAGRDGHHGRRLTFSVGDPQLEVVVFMKAISTIGAG